MFLPKICFHSHLEKVKKNDEMVETEIK